MRILLVDIVRTTLQEVWPSVEHPLGLMYLASSLRECFGDSVAVEIHTLVSKPEQADIERERIGELLAGALPDIVGLRSLSIGKDTFAVAAGAVKAWSPRPFLVAGGPYATDAPEEVLGKTPVDCVVIGEGERTFCELVAGIMSGASLGDIPGLAVRQGSGVLRTASRPLVEDLDLIPFPSYEGIDLEAFTNRYLSFSARVWRRHANILTTRGCPYRCMYCHDILGKRFRARSAENVFAEIRWLHDEHGVTDFQIVDDVFNLDRARAVAICDMIQRSGLKITLAFPNGVRGDLLDRELLEKMAAAGTRFMSCAIESAAPRIQKLIRKNLDLNKLWHAIEDATEVGIATRGFFMFGFPTETEEEARETIAYARDSALCEATFFTVVYFPGTELYRLAKSLGFFEEHEPQVQRDYVEVGEGPYAYSLATLTKLRRDAIREFAFTRRRIALMEQLLPRYFNRREIDGLLMAYVVSSGMSVGDVEDEHVRDKLSRHFIVAERFSRLRAFYV